MQFLDRTGVGTLWSMCKTKFALAGHTHNSLAAVGKEQISATAYGSGLHFKPYCTSGGPTNYGNILEYTSTNTGGGQLAMEWTGSQTKNDGTDSNVGRVYYRSKRDIINGWTKWMTLAYTDDVPTKLSQLNNDKGFVTGSVSGNTVTINGASTTWTNTWRGIQDNLTSTSTSESLSANQGRVLKGLIDDKANYSDLSSYAQKSEAIKDVDIVKYTTLGVESQYIKVTNASGGDKLLVIDVASSYRNGLMSLNDKIKLDEIELGANHYTLPVASSSTLGGIKVSKHITGTLWPIVTDANGYAYTSISGLHRANDGKIIGIRTQDEQAYAEYGISTISINDGYDNTASITFPLKSGTLALLSDIPRIPDVSNLCKLNFVNSISDCVNGRINFLFKNSNDYVDISFLRNLEEGTILLIYSPHVSFQITDKGSVWYYNGTAIGSDNASYIEHAKLVLAFFYNTYNYVSTLSYN